MSRQTSFGLHYNWQLEQSGQLMWVEPSHSTPDRIKSSVLPLVPHQHTHVTPKLFHLLTQRVLKQTFHFGSLETGHYHIAERDLLTFCQHHKEVPHPLTDW